MDFTKIAQNASKFFKTDDWRVALNSEPILNGNKAINPLHADGMMSGIPRSIYNMRHANQGFVDAVKTAHQTADGKWNPAAIAGSYIAASSAYRIMSGGGLTRDANGNPNVIGIPFV